MSVPSIPSSMSVIPQPTTSQRSSLNTNSLRNWVIWIIGILVSFLPLLVVPFVKSYVLTNYNDWFKDVFNQVAIIMISVSLAVAAIFELIARNRRSKYAFVLGGILFLLTLACILVYGIVTGINEYSLHTTQGQSIIFELTRINIAFLCMMFLLGSLSFIPEKR